LARPAARQRSISFGCTMIRKAIVFCYVQQMFALRLEAFALMYNAKLGIILLAMQSLMELRLAHMKNGLSLSLSLSLSRIN
jgi:hypothetical protein